MEKDSMQKITFQGSSEAHHAKRADPKRRKKGEKWSERCKWWARGQFYPGAPIPKNRYCMGVSDGERGGRKNPPKKKNKKKQKAWFF